MNYELRVTSYELGKAHVLCIFGIRNVKFNTAKTLIVVLSIFFGLSSVALGATLPDFTIALIDFRFSKKNPLEGESVIIAAYVKNIGGDTQSDIEVRFYEGTPDEWGLQIEKGDIIIGLKSGRGKKVEVKWRAKAGSKDIYVVIDPDNAIEESDETNNQTHRTISSRALELKKPTQAEIETAIEKGLKWLRTQQGELVVYCRTHGHENPAFMERCMICLESLKGRPIQRKDNEKIFGCIHRRCLHCNHAGRDRFRYRLCPAAKARWRRKRENRSSAC